MHQVPEEASSQPRRRGILYLLLVILLIGGMLGSAIYAVIWFMSLTPTDPVNSAVGSATATPSLAGGEIAPPTAAAKATETTRLPGADASPEASAATDRIAFIDPGGQVTTISSDGQDRRQLTEGTTTYQFPAWSPDGHYLAVIGGDRTGRGVYLMSDTGEPLEQLSPLYFSRNETPFYLYWSPDSQQVSFLANHPGETLALHLASLFPRREVRLLATGSPFYWDWSGDSNQILIHTGVSGASSQLAWLDVNNGDNEEEIANPGYFQAPGISVNGQYIAYAEEIRPGFSELIIADRETGGVHRERHAGLVAMGWNPVAAQLAVISSAGSEDRFFGPLRLVDAPSGQSTLLSRDLVLAFFWSPDGRYLAVISAPADGNDLNARQGDSEPAKNLGRLTKRWEVAVQQSPALLLDLSIIEVATGQKHYLYPFEPTRVFLNQFLPFFDQYALSHRVWSPGGQALVLPMRFDGKDSIFLVHADGKHPERLADGNMPFWSQQ